MYQAIGITKQGFHNWLHHFHQEQDEFEQLIPLIREIREDHPSMSSRVIYQMIQPESMGRDKFMIFCKEWGFSISLRKNPRRTTDSRGVIRFKNRIKDYKTTRVNEVWVSDITYYQIGQRFFYLTFIMDLHSRYIVGHQVSNTLKTQHTTMPALSSALSKYQPHKGLIFHSDGGGQYYSKEFTEITRQASIINSMTNENGENNHAERINRTIKNDYLYWYCPTSFEQLVKATQRAVQNYNGSKPHQALKGRSPHSAYFVAGADKVFQANII